MRKVAILVAAVMLVGGALWLYRQSAVTRSTTTTSAAIATTTTTTIAAPPNSCASAGDTGSSSTTSTLKSDCVPWKAQDTWSGALPSIYTASFDPIPTQPAITAYAAWIRTSSTDLALYPGYEGPGPSALARGPEMVPPSAYPRLLATFNSGFYEKDGSAGFYANQTLYFPMVRGEATVVRYTNGTVDVLAWTGGPRPGPTLVMARQNLALLVNDSVAAPTASDNALWGVTLHGLPAVWRTALGVDANGNLIYVAASDVTAQSLAAILVDLHVVRAMQLDINPEWPIFVTYAGAGAKDPSLDVPNPNQISRRFLYPSTKDFFAVFETERPGEAQPW